MSDQSQQQPQKAAPAAVQQATIRFGVYNQQVPFVGKTIGEARAKLAGQWNIPEDANPFKGKEQLADDYVIQAGDNIELHRRMGEKGQS